MAGDGSDQDTLTHGRPPANLGEEDPKYGDGPDTTENLLTLEPEKAAKANYQGWKDQPKEPISRRRAEWQVNIWRREGRAGVYAQKTQDKGIWIAWEPPWSQPPIPVLNKSDRLCRRLKNITFADDPVPEGVPATGEEEDKEAVKLGVRVLLDIQSEANLDDIRTARRAFDRASNYGSGFIRYYTDPKGGGRQPVRIMAKRGAIDADHPFTGPPDPLTPDQPGPELPGELVARYVREDGTLQDDSTDAATRWVPGLRKEILNPTSIRFLPHDAEDIWDADGVIIGTMPTWGELEDDWPEEMATITAEQKAKILAFKPEHPQDLRGLDSANRRDNRASDRDRDKRVAVFTTYHKQSPLYPAGCYFIGLGDCFMLHREPWVYQPEGGDPEAMDIPITQYIQFDADHADPFHLGLMHLMGNGNELRASQVGHLLQWLDQFANRRTFVPTNSIIQPKQLQLLQGSVIPMNPGGKPEFEDIPDYPAESLNMFTLATEEMDDHAMLQQTAQGTEAKSVQSGKQAAIITQNAMASLSEVRDNTERAYLRGCRIQFQLIRKDYTVPQQIGWTGEDGQYQQEWWSGSDLRGTADFRLKKGSLSMMTPEQKMNLAVEFKQLGAYDQAPDLFFQALTETLGPVAGLEEDPARMRIKRQLALWSKGPPEGWVAQVQAELQQQAALAAQAQLQTPVDQLLGQPGGGIEAQPGALPAPAPANPMPSGGMGMEEGQPPPPPDPNGALAAVWEPTKADELPDVATTRLGELKRFMASTRYTRWPPEWRAGLDQEFDKMKLCANVVTVPEQQAMEQQQQLEAQQQADATADRAHQDQMDLERLKQEAPQKGSQNGKGGGFKIKRDPTGRMAELNFGGGQ